MAEVVLFHHVLGMSSGVEALADRLRACGHTVHTPDLFEGRTFSTIDEGVEYAASTLGFGTVIERGAAAANDYGKDLVFAGVSMGVLPAQMLAQTSATARGAVLLEACVPVDEFGGKWPDSVPVQVHGMDNDPSFAGEGDIDAARALVAAAADAQLYLYPGNAHLFTDSSLPSYDAAATNLVIERVLELLERVDSKQESAAAR
jgi:dienelactone hydrolase